MLVEEAISKRKSIRSFSNEPVTKEEIDKLLWAGSKCPSAGGVRPFKIYVIEDKNLKDQLYKEAPVVFVVVADFNKMVSRYGERGNRYVYMEAGHIGQNISLMAVSLGLGTVMIGAFRDGKVKRVMNIQEEPIYIIPVGRQA